MSENIRFPAQPWPAVDDLRGSWWKSSQNVTSSSCSPDPLLVAFCFALRLKFLVVHVHVHAHVRAPFITGQRVPIGRCIRQGKRVKLRNSKRKATGTEVPRKTVFAHLPTVSWKRTAVKPASGGTRAICAICARLLILQALQHALMKEISYHIFASASHTVGISLHYFSICCLGWLAFRFFFLFFSGGNLQNIITRNKVRDDELLRDSNERQTANELFSKLLQKIESGASTISLAKC